MIQYMASLIERILHDMSLDMNEKERSGCACISLDKLARIYFANESYLSETSIDKMLYYMADWIDQRMTEEGRLCDAKIPLMNEKMRIGFFDLIETFALKVLRPMDSCMVVRYEHLIEWHNVTSKVGEELFVSCAYCFYDHRFGVERRNYQWEQILRHDNYELNQILRKGISDNHCHMRAAEPCFDLSWASLMNEVDRWDTIVRMRRMDAQSRNVRNAYVTDTSCGRFELMHMRAAWIRLYLYSVVSGSLLSLEDYKVGIGWVLRQILKKERPEQYFENKVAISEKDGKKHPFVVDVLNTALVDTDEKWRSKRAELKDNCPGFYWLFWECSLGIPYKNVLNTDDFFSPDSIGKLINYLDNCCEKISLHEAQWILSQYAPAAYQEMWREKTRETVYRILQDDYELIDSRSMLQGAIDAIRERGISFSVEYAAGEIELAPDECGQEQMAIVGERWLYYQLFRLRQRRMDTLEMARVMNLFFQYLLYKDKFRRELVQENDKAGFQNFQGYQVRKLWFSMTLAEGDIARSAVHTAFQGSKLKSMELRIMPARTSSENIAMVQYYDRAICGQFDIYDALFKVKRKQKFTDKFYYVFHFGKKKEPLQVVGSYVKYRHEDYRREIMEKAYAILRMRERDIDTGLRVRGIDACSDEENCRPEVFATVFRLLKSQEPNVKRAHIIRMPQLHATYHVGEDNQDVLDGIRAIDEAIQFLDLGSGDRIGHATMLGIDVAEWYERHQHKVSMRQQDYLDNVVWLYQNLVNEQISNQDNVLEYLENEFYIYFQRIYKNVVNDRSRKRDNYDIHSYYNAWTLRGDDPEYYVTGQYVRDDYDFAWRNIYGIGRNTDTRFRSIDNIVRLYFLYHFDQQVRIEGSKPVVVNIPQFLVHAIDAMQKKMRERVAQKGIAIESNPSSNLMIAGMNDLSEHPILKFYDKKLVQTESECPQIKVSINTDDAGVFVTSLYNEYSIMAHTVEHMLDDDKNIKYQKNLVYDWINDIRKMGNQQSFTKVGNYKTVLEEYRR